MRVAELTKGKPTVRDATAAEVDQRDRDAAAEADRVAQERAEADAVAADRQAFFDAITNASSLDDVKAALVGSGLPTQAEVRRKPNA